jgi:hypothetical protein
MSETINTMLSDKIDGVRNDLNSRIDRIDDKLDAIHTWMLKNPSCPKPGECVQLSSLVQAQAMRVERLELRILSIEKWQNKVIGIGSALIVIVTLFGPSIRRMFNLD